MGRKRDRRTDARKRAAPDARPPAHALTTADQTRTARFRERLAGMAIGALLGRLFRLHAAIYIAVAGVLLIIAWQSAPQRLLDAHRFASFTGRGEARIVESWLAVAWRPSDMAAEHLRWHAYAKAEPCVVVEYGGQGDQWGTLRRAFCGNRMPIDESDTFLDLKTLAPGVPFGWMRDARGFVVPEVRVGAASRRWLESHDPYSTTFLGKPPPATALAALDEQLNHPVDAAVASWTTPEPVVPIAFDPKHQDAAMPLAYVESRLHFGHGNWLILAVAGMLGVMFWLAGIGTLLHHVPLRARWVLALAPLVTLPWWSEQFPDAMRMVSRDLAAVVDDIVGGIDRTGRVIGVEPAEATLAGGERLAFPVGRRPYAATFGRLDLRTPSPLPADGDAALRALTAVVASQVRAMPAGEQIDLFMQLTIDKKNDLRGAGLAFVPAARESLLDPRADPAVRSSARRFLSEWVVQPIVEPHRSDPDFNARLAVYRELAALPIPEIAIMAGSVAKRAAQPPVGSK